MEPDALESWINRATNPLNKDLDWDSINAFCEQLNKELEGPPLATRLLAHKIQSPQEWEAIQALTVLETCMKNCGKRFHDEVGKFRFLNELIKVVSPKYLGSRTPEKVKLKILELMYSWTLGLPQEVKITEAYQMLKKQGIVKCDPKLPDEAPLPLPPPRPKNIIFDDEEKSKMLARLLKSSHSEDLRAANKLIKEMVQEDQKRMEKISKRTNAIEEVNNNVKLLTEMVTNYSKGETTESSEDLMKELYQRCERMRPMLFRLASDTEDNDEALAEILQANDNLTQVINLYKQLVRGEEINGETVAGPLRGSTSALLDLSGLDMPAPGPSYPALPTLLGGSMLPVPDPASAVSLLDDELMSLGLNDLAPQAGDSSGWNSFQDSSEPSLPSIPAAPALKAEAGTPAPGPSPVTSGLDDLDLLGKTLLQQSLPPESQQVRWEKQPAPRLTLRDLQNKTSSGTSVTATSSTPTLLRNISSSPAAPLPPPLEQPAAATLPRTTPTPAGAMPPPLGLPTPTSPQEISLANITVPLESIKPSSILPVTVYDQHGFRVLFHFARDSLPERPDMLVVVISMLSTAPLPIRNIVFQSAVPKVMKVKLQPPSGTELPAFNPIVHPTAITQVLLLANPQKEKVRLRYKLTFTMGEQTYNEMGDVDQFPPPESWGSL
ncbi:ADP-ribosylation factor-binding protein GGA1 [Trachemys scripta elegans]|uniref:ADP-ribosylation factor-binding protein GGA1 n=1 Tax=Trachemys scripta elegans TaxID=31138 RepID=UPI001556780F|nr:ADP-ribosylation factor-binding protein GGA1 [Trachemys scripta elegans]XP_053887848.1 ADP-ribosylation factor-binding protein GGA1 [Malaclemys terrapin pileata]